MMKWNVCVKKLLVSLFKISINQTVPKTVSYQTKLYLGSKNKRRSSNSRSRNDRRKTRRDSCESRSHSEDDELTAMRRKLLADRAQRKPNDLRARLAKGKKISAFINPNLSPKQPVTIKDQSNNQIQFPNFKVGRTVVNAKTETERK